MSAHAPDCALVLYAGIAKPGAQLECDCDAGAESDDDAPPAVVAEHPTSPVAHVTLTGSAAAAYQRYVEAASLLKRAQQAAQDAGVAFRAALDELNAAVLP